MSVDEMAVIFLHGLLAGGHLLSMQDRNPSNAPDHHRLLVERAYLLAERMELERDKRS